MSANWLYRAVAAAVAITAVVAGTPAVADGACTDPARPGVSWQGCEFPFSDLSRAQLAGADLRGIDLSYAVLFQADLSNANLSGANLRDAFPVGAILAGADLSNADLTDADLVGSNLSGARLRQADLTNVDLDFATISGADLISTNLTGADFFSVAGASSAVFGSAPTGVADQSAVRAGASVRIDVLSNDDPADINRFAIARAAVVTSPSNGSFDPVTAVYRPNPGFDGTDQFTYRPIDRLPWTNLPPGTQIDYSGSVATVTIRVVENIALGPPYAGASGLEGEIVRLYVAILQRPPDDAGFRYWLARRQAGETLQSIAAGFEASSEFLADNGSLSDAEFLVLAYNNIFARMPDPTGQAYWLGQMSAGLARSDLLVLMANGAEFKAVTGTS